ncbi:hypothetical protein GGR28_001521 [Lewinella aquimaris]|uniref:Copper-binding protein MbnP-like domain-containing protein n=1 Tax=Neolewinella aquimaris TaxID=1835722 RepID=A0A840E062_9BACT|nr:MbnP family protein [Neolewinella aquimaris]MBB4078904.1 hypothetical protein [Neolewinella aquimaris]
MKYLLPLLLLFVLTACQDDDDPVSATEEVELSLDFRADYAGQPLAIQSGTYTYPTGARLKVLLFQYYISDLELLPVGGGEAVRLTDIDLIRWMSASEPATTTRSYRVPAGEYRGLRFGLGVKPELNARNPSEFAADYVLNEAEFWGPTTRYVFAKIEANADLENDNTFDTGLSYHLGTDALYTTVTFDQTFRVAEGSSPAITVAADVLRALSASGQTFDISNPDQRNVHGGNQEVGRDIWERLAGQFRLEIRE